MPKICYQRKRFSDTSVRLIGYADMIINEYAEQGYDLTLRSIYYKFVARNLFPDEWTWTLAGKKWVKDPSGTKNAEPNYERLGDLVSEARLAGMIDWAMVHDRTRGLAGDPTWVKPSELIAQAMLQYQIDKWKNQKHYAEIWIEKDALVGMISGVCSGLGVKYLSCRGYTSQSEMWRASQRLLRHKADGKEIHIIHLGDHDPSGIDMSRDIKERLQLFTSGAVHVQRVALNMAQIRRMNPPPSPAKVADSRYRAYMEEFGDNSWELDAMEPAAMADVITRAVDQYRDMDLWKEAMQTEERGKKTLEMLVEHFTDVVSFLRTKRNNRVLCADCGATEEAPYCECQGRDLSEVRRIGG